MYIAHSTNGTMIKNLTLLLVSMLVCVMLAELALRFFPIGNYSLNQRVLFYSSPSLIRSDNTAVSYQPNTEIREVAVYGKNIDYDVTKKTNNMGFYDDIPYQKHNNGKRGIVFIGDSFTSGTGGDTPWVTTLRETISRSDVELYNLGVTATGVHAFYELLKTTKEKLTFDTVNLMVINSDYFRRTWYPYETKEGIRLCRNNITKEYCEKQEPTMYTIDHAETHQDLIKRAQEIYKKKNINADAERSFLQRSRLYNLYCDAWFSFNKQSLSLLHSQCPQHKINRSIWREKNHVSMYSRQLLIAMNSEFPEIKFRLFHIPEKTEILKNEYSFDLKSDIVDSKIEYISLLKACDWDISMFHKHDAHPNNKGYANLANCMVQFIN